MVTARSRPWLVVALLALATGCSAGTLDRSKVGDLAGATPTRVGIASVPVKGAEVKVWGPGGAAVSGELLAAEPGRLVLLVAGSVREIDAGDVSRVEVEIYSNREIVGGLTAWAIVGTASALSHGLLFIFSGPAWAVISPAAIAPVAADQGRFATAEGDLSLLYQHARFPQGLPAAYGRPAKPGAPARPRPRPAPEPDEGD